PSYRQYSASGSDTGRIDTVVMGVSSLLFSLSFFSSGDGEDGGGVAGARAVGAAQPPVDGAHGAADHLRDLAGGQPRLAQRREPRDGHLSGRGLLRGGGLLAGPLLGGARGVGALAAVCVVGRVVVLLRLGGGDSGVDRVDDVLPVPVRRREDVQLAVLPEDLAVEDAAGLRVGDVLAAQLSVPDVARVVVADLQPEEALQHVAVDVDAVPVALAPLFAADPDDLLRG